MQPVDIKQFFDLLAEDLKSKEPGESPSFIENINNIETGVNLSDIKNILDIHYRVYSTQHDISSIMHRLKQCALLQRDSVDAIHHPYEPIDLIAFAIQLLEERWNAIKDTPDNYTRCSREASWPYITLAKQLSNYFLSAKSHDTELSGLAEQWMKPIDLPNGRKRANIYALLIPTITQKVVPISLKPITEYDINGFILSQDGTELILKKHQPSLALTTNPKEISRLDRAKTVDPDSWLKIPAFIQKDRAEKKPLEPEDIEIINTFKDAGYQDDARLEYKKKIPSHLRNEAQEETDRDKTGNDVRVEKPVEQPKASGSLYSFGSSSLAFLFPSEPTSSTGKQVGSADKNTFS